MKKRVTALLLAAMLSANLLYVPAAALETDAGAGPAEEISVPDTVEPAPAPEDVPEDLPEDAPEDVPVDGNVPEEEPAAPETENAPETEANPAPEEPATSEPVPEPAPDAESAPDAEQEEVSPAPDPALAAPELDVEAGQPQLMAAAEELNYEVPGTNIVLRYTVAEDTGEVTITGHSGKASGVLQIPSTIDGNPVTTIGNKAFAYCADLIQVDLPQGLKTVKSMAFRKCSSLKNVVIPNTVTLIESEAFLGCTSLTRVDLPNSGIVLNKAAFDSCSSLSKVIIPSGVKSTQQGTSMDGAFTNCPQLTSIGPIGSGCSIEYGWTDVIPWVAFGNCTSVKKVIFSDTLKEIEPGAFYGCDGLEEIIIPQNIEKIGVEAFSSCQGLKKVTIENSQITLENCAFNGCPIITAGPIGSGCDFQFAWTIAIPDMAFNCMEKLERVIIPEGVTSIGDWAFNGDESLEYLYLPKSISHIASSMLGSSQYIHTDIYFEGTEQQWQELTQDLWGWSDYDITVHFNVKSPEYLQDEPLTLDLTTTVIKEGGQVTATASVAHSGGLNGTTLIWDSSNTNSVTITPGLTSKESGRLSSQVTLNGIAPGRSLITVSTADGRSAYCQVTVESDFFDIQVYRANLLLDADRPFMGIMQDEWGSKTPSSQYVKELQDHGFDTGVDIWVNATAAMDALDNPASLGEFAFMPKDVYSAIIMNILETSTDISASNDYLDVAKTGNDIYSQLKMWAKLALNVDISDREAFKAMTNAQKDEMRSKCEEFFKQRAPLGKVEKVFKVFDTVMDTVDCGVELVKTLESNCALFNMSDSLKEVVRTMYAQCPADNEYLRMALQDCIDIIDKSTDEVVQEIVKGEVKVIGKAAGKYVVGELWKEVKKVVNRTNPYLDILLAAYKSSKFLSEKVFGAESIQEQYGVMHAVLDVEDLMAKTYKVLEKKFLQQRDTESAVVYLSAVDIMFAARNEDCESAYKFIDILDDTVVSWIAKHFGSTGGEQRAEVKKQIKSIERTYDLAHENLAVGWVNCLEEDYPDSGLYETYAYLIDESFERTKKKYEVACPVDVYVYDRSQKLVAYVVDGKPYSNGDVGIVVAGDEKTFYFYDGDQYDIQYVGTDTGAMDVRITEYDEEENGIRDVYFNDVALSTGRTYSSDLNSKTMGDVTYTLNESGAGSFTPDLDTYHPQKEKRKVTMQSGSMIIGGNMELAAQSYPGERIEVYAYVPAGFTFEGWRSSSGQDIFADKTAYDTIVTVPDADVTLEAVLHREGYALALEPAGGVLPGEAVLVTDAGGRVKSLPEPTLTGCTFLGWYTAAKGGEPVTAQTVFSKDMTLYAHWDQSLPEGYTVEKDILYGVQAGTSVDALQAVFGEGENNKLNAKDKNSEPLAGNALVGTGCTVTVQGKPVTVMIPCDVDGTGRIDLFDLIEARKAVLDVITLEDVYLQAAQPTNGGGTAPSLFDIIEIRKVLLGAR